MALDERDAARQRARRLSLNLLRASHLSKYRGSAAALQGQVVITSFDGVELAGPFDLVDAEAWLAGAQVARRKGEAIEMTRRGSGHRAYGRCECEVCEGERIWTKYFGDTK